MPSPGAIRDQLPNPRLSSVRGLAVRQINHVQGERPSDQLVATALALVVMSEAIEKCPHEVVSIARCVIRDAEGPFTHQVQALRDYAQSELVNR